MSITPLTLYTNPQSRGKITEWMLAEVNAPYEKITLEFGAPMKTPEYLALNPMGKVPTLVHDGRVVTEAAAICLYLAQAFPDAGLAPTAAEAADYFRWTLFAAAPFEQGFALRALKVPLDERQKMSMGCGEFDSAVKALSTHLAQQPFVAGARFTAADVVVGSSLNYFVRVFKMLDTNPAFDAYLDRISARPAFRAVFAPAA